MYCGDYDDILPYQASGDPGLTYYGEPYINGAMDPAAATNWDRGIYPYVKNFGIYLCPVATDQDGSDGWGCFETTGALSGKPTTFCNSYGMNGIAAGKPTTSMPAPANTVLMSELTQKQKTSAAVPSWQGYGISCTGYIGAPIINQSSGQMACPDGTDGPTTGVNHMGGNYGFADGQRHSGRTYTDQYVRATPGRRRCALRRCTTQYHRRRCDSDPPSGRRSEDVWTGCGPWQYCVWNVWNGQRVLTAQDVNINEWRGVGARTISSEF